MWPRGPAVGSCCALQVVSCASASSLPSVRPPRSSIHIADCCQQPSRASVSTAVTSGQGHNSCATAITATASSKVQEVGTSGQLHTFPSRSAPQPQWPTKRAPQNPTDTSQLHWARRPLPPVSTGTFLEYIPGRDTLYSAAELAAGMDAYDAVSGEHVLHAAHLPAEVVSLARPLASRGLQLHEAELLPVVDDGRPSAGPVDVDAYLAQPAVQQLVEAALVRRRARLAGAGRRIPRRAALLRHVVHLSLDRRKVYIGDEHDLTDSGAMAMAALRSWRSCPIPTWTGGLRLADPQQQATHSIHLEPSAFSQLVSPEEAGFTAAAEALWRVLAAHPATAAAAMRMMDLSHSSPARAAACIGDTAWNAYAFNIDFRTGQHLDGKNAVGSYSALLVLEAGERFRGCYYMLPQYRAALDVREGVVLFHRSGDAEVGTHGNSGLWRPAVNSHRVALVLYQADKSFEGT